MAAQPLEWVELLAAAGGGGRAGQVRRDLRVADWEQLGGAPGDSGSHI
jgi:hypothetical protein